jgi:hypothetical protein
VSWGATAITYVPVQSCDECAHQFSHFARHLAFLLKRYKKSAHRESRAGERKFQGSKKAVKTLTDKTLSPMSMGQAVRYRIIVAGSNEPAQHEKEERGSSEPHLERLTKPGTHHKGTKTQSA